MQPESASHQEIQEQPQSIGDIFKKTREMRVELKNKEVNPKEDRLEKTKEKREYASWFQSSNIETGISNSCERLFNGNSFKDTNPNNVKKLNKILSRVGPNSFDVASIQFSAHYCFDSMLHINNLLMNLTESLKEKGIAIMTTFDGRKVYDLLKKNRGQVRFGVDNETLYTITFKENYPVICHPPCRAWGRLSHMANPRPDEKDLAWFALSQWFGVILTSRFPTPSDTWGSLKTILFNGYANGQLRSKYNFIHSKMLSQTEWTETGRIIFTDGL